MAFNWNLLHVAFALALAAQLVSGGDGGESCYQNSPCECVFSDGTSINLSNLFASTAKNGSIYLTDTQDNYTVFYHGCLDVVFNITRENISEEFCREPSTICVYNMATRAVDSIAVAKDGHFKVAESPNMHVLSYSNLANLTSVVLVCTPDFNEDKIVVHNVTDIANGGKQYRLELFSRHACRTTLPNILSTGTKLLLMFVGFVCVYFVGGACLQYFLVGARGREIIPNIGFWMSLPGLVKDGAVFLLSGCSTRLVTTAETYDQI